MVPTDLAYAFPSPTSAPAQANLRLPCCGANCPDGACRTTPTKPSERPTQRGGPAEVPTSNVVFGCCPTCHDCDQAVITSAADAKAQAATTAADAGITASSSLDDVVEKNAKFPGFQWGAHGTDAFCLGCGTCTPCDRVRLATWVDFLPHPTPTSVDARAVTDVKEEAAEPTITLSPDLVDAINGRNQDLLPIIVENGGEASVKEGGVASVVSEAVLGKGENGKELRTLMASVDLKVEENYITRRLLQHLRLLDEVKKAPKRTAYLRANLAETSVDGTIVLDVVLGAPNPQVFAVKGAGIQDSTFKLYKSVRFNVHGTVEDEVFDARDIGSEVVLGMRVLSEIGGLTVRGDGDADGERGGNRGLRGVVMEGVKVVGMIHTKDGGGEVEEKKGHDEL
jgi:hypothetical protein